MSAPTPCAWHALPIYRCAAAVKALSALSSEADDGGRDPCMMSNPRPATAADVEGMYLKAMSDPALYPVEEAVAAARL